MIEVACFFNQSSIFHLTFMVTFFAIKQFLYSRMMKKTVLIFIYKLRRLKFANWSIVNEKRSTCCTLITRLQNRVYKCFNFIFEKLVQI